MWVSLGTLRLRPGRMDDLQRAWHTQWQPAVSGERGCIQALLLETVDDSEEAIVCAFWETQQACERFQVSPLANDLEAALRQLATGPVALRIYEAAQ